MPEYLFVTGRLAAEALQTTLEKMELEFDYAVAALDVSVAALMRAEWIAQWLTDGRGCGQVMVPGLCRGDLTAIEEKLGVPVIRGPKDQKDLPLFFGKERVLDGYGEYRTQILAEIVEAYRMPWEEILAMAKYYRQSGADIIDLGCPPMEGFPGVGGVVAGLKDRGFIVSVDTFDPETIREADEAGVDLLLSVNSHNMHMVTGLHCRVVVVPDFGEGLESLERNVAQVASLGASYIIDPILDPLSFGFTESLRRYSKIRRRYPKADILMGLGNLTELTDADSIGINALMAGVMAELEIDYVLTTEVISWCRGSVRELDLARKLMYYAHKNRALPKSIDDGLIALKDPPFDTYSEQELRVIQSRVRDEHYRIFADRRWVYVFNGNTFLRGSDPYELFDQLEVADPGHAFYLGRELERAALAVQLGKKYSQESELRWGYLSADSGEG